MSVWKTDRTINVNTHSYLPDHISHLFEKWSQNIENFSEYSQKIEYFQKELPVVLKDKSFFIDVLEKITKGSPFPDIRRSGLFENEVILFTNASRLFSVRFAIYEPGEYTVIHDHSSWGVFGTVFGSLEVIKYQRLDDRSVNHCAKLAESTRFFLDPIDTDFTLPLDKGIHSIGNPTDQPILTSSIYGNPVRRLFINGFDIKSERIYPIYPPKIKKKRQAQQALKILILDS
jgi:hypothetical protein